MSSTTEGRRVTVFTGFLLLYPIRTFTLLDQWTTGTRVPVFWVCGKGGGDQPPAISRSYRYSCTVLYEYRTTCTCTCNTKFSTKFNYGSTPRGESGTVRVSGYSIRTAVQIAVHTKIMTKI